MSEATANATGERLSGREAAIARRQALSQYGKKAVKGGGAATPASATAARAKAHTDTASATGNGQAEVPSARDSSADRTEKIQTSFTPPPPSAARQRRAQQSSNGRGSAPAARPTGRTRTEPQKVELGTTLAGTPVSGSQVERTSRVTGNEAGTCRKITGTEYIGTEQYVSFCRSVPAPAAAKVAMTSTSRGKVVTGTEVGRSGKVTGDEIGSCKRVTGSEYYSAEQATSICGTPAEPHPEKVVIGMTAARNAISGSDTSRKTWVTGDEVGAGRAITGSAYADAQTLRAPRGDAPKKVETSHTGVGGAVSGSSLGRSSNVTGNEAGSCKRVTGSEYISSEEFASICRSTPFQSPAKVGMTQTLRGESVSGTRLDRSALVTGDEYGACKPVTGTSYIGADQYAEFCASRVAAEAIQRAQRGRSPALTGIQPGPDEKMTGNERGECLPVSGTPYLGDDQQAKVCGGPAMAMARHPRGIGPQGTSPSPAISGSALAIDVARQPGEFSVLSPARGARISEVSRITGSAYGASGRITGPMARATGLVSGTPEFRYRDDTSGVIAPAVAATPAPAQERITGEGRERSITGDNWDRGDRVTGTEGLSAKRRNPTQRGEPRSIGAAARVARDTERPAPPTSRVTGSSGNSQGGAAVTLSGGARG